VVTTFPAAAPGNIQENPVVQHLPAVIFHLRETMTFRFRPYFDDKMKAR
jgi:hypothetical protein